MTPGQRLDEAIARIAGRTAGRARSGTSHDDADAERGTIETDDAIGFDPRPLLRALSQRGARAVVIGQVAGILHGSRELTGDLDLLWSGRPEDAGPLLAAFTACGAQLYDDDRNPIDRDPPAFARDKVQFHTPLASGDCCTLRLPWGDLDVGAFLARAVRADLGGHTVRYVALDDLLTMREAVDRPKDRRRAAELRSLRPPRV